MNYLSNKLGFLGVDNKFNVKEKVVVVPFGLEASMELAKEKGTYSSFEGSPISEGKFQFNMWDVKPSGLWDWDKLKEKVLEHRRQSNK